MDDDIITIDVDQLRNDMRDECMGAAFGGGFGGALVEAMDIDRATDEQVVEMAQRKGIDIKNYQV
jgi:hypothetical protein